MPIRKSSTAFPGLVSVPPKPKSNLKAPKPKMFLEPIAFPRSKAMRQLPISRTKTFVFAPIEKFAGTRKRTI